jgi:hypothetical protein
MAHVNAQCKEQQTLEILYRPRMMISVRGNVLIIEGRARGRKAAGKKRPLPCPGLLKEHR